ncbi:hypothetical protein [Borrelia hispanica]|uniref:hypothetical protein n=1 Tax=Borrelia hispanica TaxID=40835 RepID=UPI000467EBD0|nr:hypothetical protein [Borrelia hispanica]
MQKWLKSLVILCLLISCNTQGNKPDNITNSDSMMLNTKAKATTKKLNLDVNEALIFLINVLTNNTIANNIKIYTDERINEFIIHFNSQQINEMVTNIIKLLEIKKNIKDNIKILNDDYDNMATPIKMSLTKKLNDKLEEEINNYKIAIKIAADHDSFDIAKINIQNIPITKIIKIKDEAKQAVDAQNEIINTNAEAIKNNLDPKEREALKFITETLQNTNRTEYNTTYIYNRMNKCIKSLREPQIKEMVVNTATALQDTIIDINKIYTNTQINKFINYLGEQQIKEMVVNTVKALEEIENLKTNINILYDDTYQINESKDRIKEEINNYKIAIKIAANHESFDIAKINIQNIPITNITEIKDEIKRAIDVQNRIKAHLPGDYDKYYNAITYLKEIFPEGNTYTHDTFNRFILNIHLDKAKYLLTHFTEEFNMINYTVTIITSKSTSTSQKSKLKSALQKAFKDLEQSMRTAFGNGTLPLDTIKQNFQNVHFHKIKETFNQANQVHKEQFFQHERNR